MTQKNEIRNKEKSGRSRRIAKLAAAFALVTALAGCVVYGGPPRYGYYHPYWHDHYDWR